MRDAEGLERLTDQRNDLYDILEDVQEQEQQEPINEGEAAALAVEPAEKTPVQPTAHQRNPGRPERMRRAPLHLKDYKLY